MDDNNALPLREIEIQTVSQGLPDIAHVYIAYKSEHVAIVYIDMRSKYIADWWGDNNEITLEWGDHSLHPHPSPNSGLSYGTTVFKIPELEGYDLLCGTGGRYSLYFTFVRNLQV